MKRVLRFIEAHWLDGLMIMAIVAGVYVIWSQR